MVSIYYTKIKFSPTLFGVNLRCFIYKTAINEQRNTGIKLPVAVFSCELRDSFDHSPADLIGHVDDDFYFELF